MRIVPLLIALALLLGCATNIYTSNRPALDISECIAGGWRKAPRSGYEVPVSLTKSDEYYFVGVELHPTFPSLVVTGTEHPFYAVWAEVRESPSGSKTKYHRAYQITHEVIDRVVVECQGTT
jgi:hypothetical protein